MSTKLTTAEGAWRGSEGVGVCTTARAVNLVLKKEQKFVDY